MLEPLKQLLDSHDLGAGEIAAEPIGEGHSNVTYLIARANARFVLRRPPRPPVPPSANDVLREARLLRALQDEAVPTAPVLAVCEDEGVIGAPFFVMPFLEGHVMTDAMPATLDTPEQRRRVALELVDALVAVHAVDWRSCGLASFAKPAGYLARQLKRFAGLWEYNKTREVPAVDEVSEWLAANLPETSETTLVHGDYRLGNVMFELESPARVKAIFDWELATLGDPLADLGYLTATWSRPDEGVDTTFHVSAVTNAEGFPSARELTERYAAQSGRGVRDMAWYRALAVWKATIFMEGNCKRAMMGNSDDPYLKRFAEVVPELAETAWRITRA